MIRLQFFGGLSATQDGRFLAGAAAQPRRLALLAVLADAGPRGTSRERLLQLLWPDADEARARRNLSQALYALRRDLHPEAVQEQGRLLALDPAIIRSDLADLEDARARRDGIAAAAAVTGRFLDGVRFDEAPEFERWADGRARHYDLVLADLLRGAATEALAAGRLDEARALSARLVAVDPLGSGAALCRLEVLAADGDAAAALVFAREYRERVQRELGVAADAGFVARAEALRVGAVGALPAASASAVSPVATDTTSAPSSVASASSAQLVLANASSASPAAAVVPSAPLFEGAAPSPAHPTTADGAAVLTPPRRSRWRLPVIAGLLVAAGLAGVAALRRVSHPGDPAPRLAVAVLENRTGDPALEIFGDMAADWLVRRLADGAGVDLVESATLAADGRDAQGAPTPPREFARRHGAGLVIGGTVLVVGDSLAVQLALLETETGRAVATPPPVLVPRNRPFDALEPLQQRAQVAVALQVGAVTRSSDAARERLPTATAYAAFVAAQRAYWRGEPPPAVLAPLRVAATADTGFLAAQVWLAFLGANGAGCALADSMAGVLAPRRPRLSEFDRLTLDLALARCRSAWEEALGLAERQAALRPRSTYAEYTAGFFALAANRPERAESWFGRIRPTHDLGWISDSAKVLYWRDRLAAWHLAGRHADELRAAREVARATPQRLTGRLFLARAFAASGRPDSALALVRTAVDASSDGSALLANELSPMLLALLIAGELESHGHVALADSAAQLGAEAWRRRAGTMPTASPVTRAFMARLLMRAGDVRAARDLVRPRSIGDSADVWLVGTSALAALADGAVEEANAWRARLETLPPSGARLMQQARFAAMRGEAAAAATLLGEATRAGAPRTLAGGLDPHLDPAFARIRDEPGIRAQLRPRR